MRQSVLSILIPPLPVDRFAAFKQFVEKTTPNGWQPRGAPRAMRFADAAELAESIRGGVGKSGLAAGYEHDDALAACLTSLNSAEGRAESERALRLLDTPQPTGFIFAFDTPGQGFDSAAWGVPAVAVKHLNAWCCLALVEFYKATGGHDPTQLTLPLGERRGDPPAEEQAVPAGPPADKPKAEPIPAETVRTEADSNPAANSQAQTIPKPLGLQSRAARKQAYDNFVAASDPHRAGMRRSNGLPNTACHKMRFTSSAERTLTGGCIAAADARNKYPENTCAPQAFPFSCQ
jgi:hypothetical protein